MNVSILIQALERSRDKFRFYALEHHKKGTPDGYTKEAINLDMADMITVALTTFSNSAPPLDDVHHRADNRPQSMRGAIDEAYQVGQADRLHWKLIAEQRVVSANEMLERMRKVLYRADALAARLDNAEARLYDMALQDDGQAFSEAERYLQANRPDLYERLNKS
jgi:hypothetical protein